MRPEVATPTLSLGHFQVGSYRYRCLIEALYTLVPTCSFLELSPKLGSLFRALFIYKGAAVLYWGLEKRGPKV